MVQTLRSRRSYPSLSDCIGSGRPERRANLLYSDAPHATVEARTIAAVAIVNQKSRWRVVPDAVFHDLLCGPVRRGMLRHFNVENLSTSESDGRRRRKASATGPSGRRKSRKPTCPLHAASGTLATPCWGLAPAPSHIFGHGPCGNLKPQPCQLGPDAPLTPKAILGSHASDESLKLSPDRRATPLCLTRRSPPPVRPPTRALPA
jgi:hypothetical protein